MAGTVDGSIISSAEEVAADCAADDVDEGSTECRQICFYDYIFAVFIFDGVAIFIFLSKSIIPDI